MIPSLRPGNFAMMLLIGNLPTGVCAVNLSCSTSTPLSFERTYCSSLACPGLPTGREPIATISFTYCITRLPLMSGLGAVLVEFAGAGLAAGAAIAFVVVAAGLTSADASDGVCCLLHPKVTAATGTSRQTASRETRIRRGFMLQTL